MALRADTARHIITGVTVLVFSAAAIGTAMRYQERIGPIQMPTNVELPAPEALPGSPAAATAPSGYLDATRGSGADIAAKLEGTLALGAPTEWPYREGGGPAPAANLGSAGWWGKTTASLTPTSSRGRSRAGGSGGGPGGGGGVSGNGGNTATTASAPNGPKTDRPASGSPASGNGRGNSGGSGGGSGNGSGPVFNDHAPSVGDLVDDTIAGLGDVAAPGVSGDVSPGGLSHTPEPTSLLLMATGVAGVLAARRRRQARRG